MELAAGGSLGGRKFFLNVCQVLVPTSPCMMSTTTEREGNHEQETDSNAGGRGNGRSDVRPSGPRIPWRSWSRRVQGRSTSDAPCAAISPPSPPLRVGSCWGGSGHGGACARHRKASARGGSASTCGGTCARGGNANACGGACAGRDHDICDACSDRLLPHLVESGEIEAARSVRRICFPAGGSYGIICGNEKGI